MKGMGPLRIGVENCQKALDYIKAHPASSTPQVAAALGWTQDAARARLRRMAERGELQESPAVHTTHGPDGTRYVQRTHAFVALVDTTRSIEETAAMLQQNLPRKDKNPNQAERKSTPKWVTKNTRYDDPLAKPLRNQGGQGSVWVRPRGYCTILGE